MKRLAPVAFIAGLCFMLCSALPASAPAAEHPMTASLTVGVYASEVRKSNPGISDKQSRELARALLRNASRWRVDANVLAAVVTVESSWRTNATSNAGAIGLGQLTPATAADLGVNPHNPQQNLAGAARYLSELIALFGRNAHRYEFAFAAYNAGPNAVKQFHGIPPYSETQHYVLKVLRTLRDLRRSVHKSERAALKL